MKTNYEIRYASHPEDAKSYDTTRIRRDFLIEKVFAADGKEMSFWDHLDELRGTIIRSVAAVCIFAILALAVPWKFLY